MASVNFEDYKTRKTERLRLGQATCEVAQMLSDPEIRVALVPLTEAEYSNSLHEADKLPVTGTASGTVYQEEIQRQYVLYYSCRVVGNLEQRFFSSFDEVGELDAHELNHLFDIYLEMVNEVSPSMFGLTEEDFTDLKKAFGTIQWSELSGQQWYAAQRFLNSIRPLLLTDRSSGLPSTTPSTPTSIEKDSATSA